VARHLHDARREPEPPHGLRQPVVVGEHDDLPILRDRVEHRRQAVHARGIHRLDGVVDDQEPERALG
jgi:hypothetical protein